MKTHPYIARSDVEAYQLGTLSVRQGRLVYTDERPEDRDAQGVLWARQVMRYCEGRPIFGKILASCCRGLPIFRVFPSIPSSAKTLLPVRSPMSARTKPQAPRHLQPRQRGMVSAAAASFGADCERPAVCGPRKRADGANE